jgi:molybdate transport system substrate-binding protein
VRIVKSVPKEIYGPAYAVIGILSGTAKRPLAQSFVDFLLSAEGQTLLKEHDVPILARVDAFVPCGMLSAFLDIKRQYEQLHPGVTVNLTFDRADALTSRILEDGDRPDVHFSIGQVEADLLVRGNAVKERTAVPFGRFDMALCVNETKQGVVRGLEDLTKPEVGRIVLTPAENSSVGHYARETLERAGLWQAVEGKVSYLPTIKDCYSELAGGRADAGFAYIGCPVPIDPEKAEYSKVKPVMTVPADLYGSATVYASVLSGAIHAEEARRFVAFLASPSSRASLARIGLQALDGEGFSAAQTSRQ